MLETIKVDLHVADVLRANAVERWQLVSTSRVQSLAEHTFNVMAIAMVLAAKTGQSQGMALMCAFMHDIPEVLTGDIPTPVKEVLGLKPDLNSIEAGIEFCGRTTQDSDWADVKTIVKAADILDACLFLHFYGVDTPHTRFVKEKLLVRLSKYDMAWSLYKEIIDHEPHELGEIYGSWERCPVQKAK